MKYYVVTYENLKGIVYSDIIMSEKQFKELANGKNFIHDYNEFYDEKIDGKIKNGVSK